MRWGVSACSRIFASRIGAGRLCSTGYTGYAGHAGDAGGGGLARTQVELHEEDVTTSSAPTKKPWLTELKLTLNVDAKVVAELGRPMKLAREDGQGEGL